MKKIIKNVFSLPTDKLLIRLLFVSLIPFILISFFNNPATDDFYLANLSLKHGLIEVHFWHYNNWSGRYFSNGILFFSPLYFGNFYLYKFIPILLIFATIFSIKYFISTLFHAISNTKKWAISSIISILYLIQVVDVCSAFYWLPAAITYHFGIVLTLFLVSFYVQYKRSNKFIYLLLTTFFIAFSMGCNEIITILNSLLMGVYFVYQLWKTKKINFTLFVLVLIAAIFANIELLAPGNAARNEFISSEGRFNLINSLFKSFVHTILFTLKWLPLLLLFVLIKIKMIYEFINKNQTSFIHPIWSLILLFSILFISLFPSFYIQNNMIADRSLNVIYFYFIIFGVYSILCVLNFVLTNYDFKIQLNTTTKTAITIILLFFTFSDSPITNAYEDLVNGKAFSYNNQMKNRFELIKNATEKEIVVPALTKKPQTIYQDIFMGLTPDAMNWKNQDISEYYGKIVTVNPSEIEVIE